ncbi:ankyrin repeat domain-containing protein SOWAHB [Rhynchocyon petersi]
MAQELSQEALLDFLCQAGGRVTNAALLSHFRSFIRDPSASPGEHQRRRELFKGFVNSVAAVRQDPDGTKYVVLKRRYRDLLGEEGLQGPRQPPAAAAPAGGAAPRSPRGARRGEPQPRRRRDRKREEEPAGAAARVPDAACNGLAAAGAREAALGGGSRQVSSGQRSPGPVAAEAAAEDRVRRTASEAAAEDRARCAAVGTRGRCCWECHQNSSAGLLGQAHPDPAAVVETAARTAPAQRDFGAPGQRLEGAPAESAQERAEPAQEPAAIPAPPAPVEAAGSEVSPPATAPGLSPPGDQLERLGPSALHYSTLQQQQRTLEWVTRHPQTPQPRDQGPIRAWSVLPDNFLQLPLQSTYRDSESNSALSGAPLSSHSSNFTAVPDESSASGLVHPSVTVFRSIRSQLSLQDLQDFVDQESHGSEESTSEPKESPAGSEDGTPHWGKLRNPAEDVSLSAKEGSPGRSPQSHRGKGDVHSAQHIPSEVNCSAGHPQEPSLWPAPKLRQSLRRRSKVGGAKLSSSDEELHDEDLLKRNRGPRRSRKTSKAGAMPSPRMDTALISKPAEIKVVTEQGRSNSPWVPSTEVPATLGVHRPEHKSSLVPLDAREHEWIVKLASGSWIQVLTLFWEDPQLVLYKDFLTGYTALHWMAKHGDLEVLQSLVSGAQRAGITLDVNVRSSCGYTPLHLAAIHGHQGVIKLLVERLSSRVNVRDNSGKKPWQYLASNTSGEIWQLLKAPRGTPIFPVYPLVRSCSPTRKTKSREVSRNITRKTSLAAFLKSHHSKWKSANQYEKFPTLHREEYSD